MQFKGVNEVQKACIGSKVCAKETRIDVLPRGARAYAHKLKMRRFRHRDERDTCWEQTHRQQGESCKEWGCTTYVTRRRAVRGQGGVAFCCACPESGRE